MRVLVGGGTGFIGSHLVQSLARKNHQVTSISRHSGPNLLTWKELNEHGLPACDAVVQVTGANFFEKTWTPERKKELIQSRIGVTENLVKLISEAKEKPKVFVCASAIGYYPILPRGQTFDEYYNGPPADNFAGEVVAKWEEAVKKAPKDVRLVMTRFGIVLEKGGGALSEMLLPFKMGVGGPMGSGNQYWPWIHMQDVIGVIEYALDHSHVSGPVNVVSPESCTNREFSSTLGSVLNRPTIFKVPEFALKLMFGERHYMLSEGSRVVPKKLQEWNYQFKYPKLRDALASIVK